MWCGTPHHTTHTCQCRLAPMLGCSTQHRRLTVCGVGGGATHTARLAPCQVFRPNEQILREGEVGDWMFILMEGAVQAPLPAQCSHGVRCSIVDFFRLNARLALVVRETPTAMAHPAYLFDIGLLLCGSVSFGDVGQFPLG